MSETNKQWIAVCGLDCTDCDIRTAPFDAQVAERLVAWFQEMAWLQQGEGLAEILARRMYCMGCHGDRSLHWSPDCWILQCCVDEKGLRYCYECHVFPCERLREWAGQNEGYAQALERSQRMRDAKRLAAQINAEIDALPVQNTPSVRAIRRQYSRRLKKAAPQFVLELARELVRNYGYRGVPYELIEQHRAAFRSLGEAELEQLGRGINSWWSVDSFARTLTGPAWRDGQVPDELIHKWAHSEDRWWRRAALVSTVALNVRSRGGRGDVPRTLEVCRFLVDDHDDMVVKAMSWALRELIVHDPQAVREFLAEHDDALAARVKREVRNKLTTGRKNPRRKGGLRRKSR